jgi:murein DD-endopeptidase MepM/ murein hydrolase activator NlpD
MKPVFAVVVSLVALASSGVIAIDLPPAFPPIDVEIRTPPRPFVVSGIAHLAYELHLRNLSSRRVTLERIEVHDGNESGEQPPLLSLEGAALDASLMRPGAPLDDPDRRVLTAGRTAILFVWLQTSPRAVPATLTHRFTVRAEVPAPQTGRDQRPGPRPVPEVLLEIGGIDVPVSMQAPPVMSAPLSGDLWLAGNGPDNSVGHRRTVMALRGEGRIAQRFAIDWVRLFPDGKTFHGDPDDNRSYRAFGAEVLAVSGATVVETKDGIPENKPDLVARAVPITPATVGGNFVLLELTDGAYALYAHLQPGSLRVKTGDRVRRGQVLALVGTSGNSTEPHLHFQVADQRRPFDAEGIPYSIASFDLQADPKNVTPALKQVGGSLGIEASELRKWISAPAQRRTNEMPMMNALVDFGTHQSR